MTNGPKIEWRVVLHFTFNLNDTVGEDWEIEEPYPVTKYFSDESAAREFYEEARGILERAPDGLEEDAEPSDEQKQFALKHEIEMEYDDSDYNHELALLDVWEFIKVENLIEEER